MKKLLIIFLLSMSSLACSADNSKCSYSEDMIKQTAPQNAANIAAYYWQSGLDKRSDEHLKTLHIIYKNGDHAVIQHKFCSMYNFEVIYLRNSQADYLDAGSIAKIASGLYTQYAAKKAKFSRPLDEIILTSLKKAGFDVDKNSAVGLPENDASYPNARVEYSLDYKSLDEFSSIYSSVTKFYVGIGGAT